MSDDVQQSWIHRPEEEKKELDVKIKELGDYIDSESYWELWESELDQALYIQEQFKAMVKHSLALERRIELKARQ